MVSTQQRAAWSLDVVSLVADWRLLLLYLFVTEVLERVYLCVSSGQDLTWRPTVLWGAEPAMRQGAQPACQKTDLGPHLGWQGCVDTICPDVCNIPTLCRRCLFGTLQHRGHRHCILHTTHHKYIRLNIRRWREWTLWYSHTGDHRGQLISDIISNSEHITLNTDTPIRVPHTTLQQATSPDITTISTTLYNCTTWHTIHTLNLDHLHLITTINTRTKYKLQQNRHTFTNYRKANWTQFTTDTEATFSDIQPPPDIHTANTIFTNITHHTDKHNIPKGKVHSTCKLHPEHIIHKIEHRYNIRAQNAIDPLISD